MNLEELKDRGFKIVTSWQECNNKSIYLFDSNNYRKFEKYKNLALKKKCKFIICDIKFKKYAKKNSIQFFFYKSRNDLFRISFTIVSLLTKNSFSSYLFTCPLKSLIKNF